jgi:predicted TIM-barrel fold metal-dependent hydrolase
MKKDFPVFDCDAHVNDPVEIWEKYVPESKKEIVRQTYWHDENGTWLNGSRRVSGGGVGEFGTRINQITIAGPHMTKQIQRKLMTMPLTAVQRDYLDHKGAYNPKTRIQDMNLMGIDQVLVIPTMTIMNLPFAENAEGVAIYCRAYNDWVCDWCSEAPDRLFGAAILPLQDPRHAAAEIERVAERGLKVVLIRPIDAQGTYPNLIGPAQPANVAPEDDFDRVFRAIEETGLTLGMHTFPGRTLGRTAGPGTISSPGELITWAGAHSSTLSFVYEMQGWLAQILLAGFLDRYPRLRMVVFESNSSWLPYLLETCDRLFKLHTSERRVGDRLPSEAFYDQCMISFEGDEELTLRMWPRFEKIGIWASDVYHLDGSDAWTALREMNDLGVPKEVQAKLMGANASHAYGIELNQFVTDEAPAVERPDWFPSGQLFDEWVHMVRDPRSHLDELETKGYTPVGFPR